MVRLLARALIAPLLAGAIGAAVERYGLRRVHKNGHVAELLFTFGLAFAIEEVVQIIWGKSPVDFRVPPSLDFPAFTIFSTNYPAYKMFMLLVSIVIFIGLADHAQEDADRPDRAGGADPSAHGRPSRPQRRPHLHAGVRRRHRARRRRRRDRRSRAGDAGEHGRTARPDPVRGRGGRRTGLAARRLRRLAADRPGPDLCGLDERLIVRRLRPAQP